VKLCVEEMIINKNKVALLVNLIPIHTFKNKKFSTKMN